MVIGKQYPYLMKTGLGKRLNNGVYMKDLKYVQNEEIIKLIDSYIHSERDRALMKRKMVDGIHFEPLAEEFEISVTTAKRIYKTHNELIETLL